MRHVLGVVSLGTAVVALWTAIGSQGQQDVALFIVSALTYYVRWAFTRRQPAPGALPAQLDAVMADLGKRLGAIEDALWPAGPAAAATLSNGGLPLSAGPVHADAVRGAVPPPATHGQAAVATTPHAVNTRG